MTRMLLAVAVVGLASAAGFAGARGGPKVANTVVNGNGTDVFTVVFVGGQTAEVIVDGGRHTDLDLFVYDENGTLVAKDDDTTSYCIARWTPPATGKYTLRVVNLGAAGNRYTITTN